MTDDDSPQVTFTMSERTVKSVSYALADVLCWFSGFAAGNPDYSNPCDLDALRNFKIRLRDNI